MVEVREIEGHIKIQHGSGEINMRGLFATEDIPKKTVILKLQGEYLPFPTQTSIEIMKGKHIEDDFGAFVNHHCSPNSRILCHFRDLMWLDNYVPSAAFHESAKLKPGFLSDRDIKKGQEINIDYNDTEYDIAVPFKCFCHNKTIKGKKYVK